MSVSHTIYIHLFEARQIGTSDCDNFGLCVRPAAHFSLSFPYLMSSRVQTNVSELLMNNTETDFIHVNFLDCIFIF